MGLRSFLRLRKAEMILKLAESIQYPFNISLRMFHGLLGPVIGNEDIFWWETGTWQMDSDSRYCVSVAVAGTNFSQAVQRPPQFYIWVFLLACAICRIFR